MSTMISTRPKRIGPIQNNWYSTKMIRTVQNHFGPTEGQEIRVYLPKALQRLLSWCKTVKIIRSLLSRNSQNLVFSPYLKTSLNKGCGCHFGLYGCCPDGMTGALGINFTGCACETFTYGCCMDGISVAQGPNLEGCSCNNSLGCCPDGVTPKVRVIHVTSNFVEFCERLCLKILIYTVQIQLFLQFLVFSHPPIQ